MTEQITDPTIGELAALEADLMTVVNVFMQERNVHPAVTASLLATLAAKFIYTGTETLEQFDASISHAFTMARIGIHQSVKPQGTGH